MTDDEVGDPEATLELIQLADSAIYMPADPDEWAWRFLVALCDATHRGWIEAVDVISSDERQGIEVELTRTGSRATAAYRRRQANSQEREEPTP